MADKINTQTAFCFEGWLSSIPSLLSEVHFELRLKAEPNDILILLVSTDLLLTFANQEQLLEAV